VTVEVYLAGDTSPVGSGDRDNDGVADEGDPVPANPNLCRDTDGDPCDDCTNTGADGSGGDSANDGHYADSDGICDARDDMDDDGVTDADDIGPEAPPATVVCPAMGCSVAQLVPYAGRFGSSEPWQNHRPFIAAVTQTAQGFLNRG